MAPPDIAKDSCDECSTRASSCRTQPADQAVPNEPEHDERDGVRELVVHGVLNLLGALICSVLAKVAEGVGSSGLADELALHQVAAQHA